MGRVSFEEELNELRAAIAESASTNPKTVKALAARVADLEKRYKIEEDLDPYERIRDRIVRALAVANNGKPGYLSYAQIAAECKLTKSQVHGHVNALDKAGRVWIRKWHHPAEHGDHGRPAFYVYHPQAVRA